MIFDDDTVQEVVWLSDDSIIYINGTSPDVKGGSGLWISHALNTDKRDLFASLPTSVSNLKPVFDEGRNLNFVVSALANPDETVYNSETAPKKYTSGLSYESLFVRHWDTYVKPEKSTLFTGILGNDKVIKELKNLLSGVPKLETPVAPFGGTSDFDVSRDGKTVAFHSKSPDLSPANNTQTLIYLVPADGSSKPSAINIPDKKDAAGNALPQGASSSPIFSPDGKYLAYLQMYKNGYESDQNKIFLYEVSSRNITPLLKDWDNSPSSIVWSTDSSELFLIAENNGRGKVFKTPASGGASAKNVTELISEGSVNALSVLPSGELLVSKNSLTSSTGYSIFDVSSKTLTALLSPAKVDSQLSSLGQVVVEDFSFNGAEGVTVHGLITKPSDFDAKKKWKMAFFIHGGPQGAWTDSWSTRWNPAVFAEAGYVVVAVNPTGSTGYGQGFVDGIQGQWGKTARNGVVTLADFGAGGRPYIDLERAVEYLENTDKYSYIDFDRTVALGASYGGFMINYIQGKPLGRKFKALVCHDGVFSTLNQYSSEELYFPQHDVSSTFPLTPLFIH